MLQTAPVLQPFSRPLDANKGRIRYTAKIAAGRSEILSALKLRYDVFHRELKCGKPNKDGIDLDIYDMRSLHLIVVDQTTGETVGTYRLGNLPQVDDVSKLYCSGEFDLSQLPNEIIRDGIEVGRACIAVEHRNSRVLLKLWQGLINILESSGKRYIFGCCSIFTDDPTVGAATYDWLKSNHHVEQNYSAEPANRTTSIDTATISHSSVIVPPLLDMYLRCGARICSPPIYDAEFGSVDMLVVFDIFGLSQRQRRLFARA